MRPGEDVRASLGKRHEIRRDELTVRDYLHVPELAHVEVESPHARPAEEDVARRLDVPLAADHPLAMARVRARAKKLLVDRRPGLLDLQKQGLLAVAALKQYQVHLHPDTSDADDLANDVDEREAVEQPAPFVGQAVVI